jgi:NAD(P)-dependent dehydrogenase (short-subunit alcohol dehydrogenase family)
MFQQKLNMICKQDLIIIGASGGIGQYIVNHYKDSCNIYGTYHQHDTALIQGNIVRYYKVDVQNKNSIKAFIDTIQSLVEKPILIYTPAVSINNTVHNYNEDDWDTSLAINLTVAMFATKYMLPKMKEVNYGRIIYFSSILSKISVPGTVAYTTTKAALNALARIVTKENAKKNITANSLVLGYYDIGIISKVPKDYLAKEVLPNIPSGKLGNPVNIVNAIDFIIKSDFIAGSAIDISGGM